MAIDIGNVRQAKGQEAFRVGGIFYDDFQRPYDVVMDTRTFAPVGIPIPKFRAPVYVPPRYLATVHGQLGRFKIDFDGWLDELRDAERMFQQALGQLAKSMFPNNYAQALETPEQFPALLHEVGDAPLSERFVRAMRVGNPWVLGARDDLDPTRWFTPTELRVLERVRYVRQAAMEQEMVSDAIEFAVAEDETPPIAQYAAVHPADAAEFGAEVTAQFPDLATAPEVLGRAAAAKRSRKPTPKRDARGHFLKTT